MKQNQQIENRRFLIKTLALAGFGLMLPSCRENRSELILEPVTEDSSENDIDEIVSNQHVSFFVKDSEQYNQHNVYFNLNVVKTPTVIAVCTTTEGVATAVAYAKQNNYSIAVKSGGHSFERFSSNDGGLVIDLSMMNQLEWVDDYHIKVGPGLLLKDLYSKLFPVGKLLPAGSCGTVGIGGLTLGGGYGFFARQYGLTCDFLEEATVVDGEGNIHRTKTGEELMWGLKGGNNGNFGIVTEMKFKTIVAPNTFTRHRFKAYDLDVPRIRLLLQTWMQYAKELSNDCFSAFVLNNKTLTVLNTTFKEAASKELQALNQALTEVCDNADIGQPAEIASSLKNYYGIQEPLYFQNSSAGYYDNFEDLGHFIDDISRIVTETKGVIFQVNTLGGHINFEGFKQESSYPHRDQYFLTELQTYWEENQDSERLKTAFNNIHNILNNNNVSKHYRNYPFLHIENSLRAYYGDNLSRLQDLKSKYDPNNRINHPQSITV